MLWVKLCLKLPENHINMSYEHEKQFQISLYMQFNDMNMRLLSLKSYQNIECRTRGYFERVKNITSDTVTSVYRQGNSMISSCGTNILALSTDRAKAVRGNQPIFEEPACYLEAWTNRSYGLQKLYDNTTEVFWC